MPAAVCPRCKRRPAHIRKGSNRWCKPCTAEHRREWRKKNLDKSRDQIYAQSIKRRFGMSLADYEQMLEAQGGVCAICGREEYAKNKDGTSRRLQIDHDHRSGQVRSLLCSGCNHGLGGFDDDPTRLTRAVEYLARGGGVLLRLGRHSQYYRRIDPRRRNRQARPQRAIRIKASATMRRLILERPVARSTNVIGTSTMRLPARCARNVIST